MLFSKLSPLGRRSLPMALVARQTKQAPFAGHASWLSSKDCCLNTKPSLELKGFHSSSYLSALHITGSSRIMEIIKEEARIVDLKNVKQVAYANPVHWFIEDNEGASLFRFSEPEGRNHKKYIEGTPNDLDEDTPLAPLYLSCGDSHSLLQEENSLKLILSEGVDEQILKELVIARQYGLKIVCFALENNSCFVKWDNGMCFWNQLPDDLHELLHGKEYKRLMPVEFVSLGSFGRWFVRFENGHYMISDDSNECKEVLSRTEELGGRPHEVLFGKYKSEFLILYEPGPLSGKVAEPKVE